jgi:hypothetical protein
MTAISKAMSLLAISAALILSGSHVFAKNDGPGQVKTSGTSAAPSGSGAGGSQPKAKLRPCVGHQHYNCGTPGHTQPPCRGGHMGPNGVMIQCQ